MMKRRKKVEYSRKRKNNNRVKKTVGILVSENLIFLGSFFPDYSRVTLGHKMQVTIMRKMRRRKKKKRKKMILINIKMTTISKAE